MVLQVEMEAIQVNQAKVVVEGVVVLLDLLLKIQDL
jgi:hypothetical protein